MSDFASLSLAAPGQASAYGRIIRGTGSPREIEYRVFAEATAGLEAVGMPNAALADRIQALHGNRELWTALACDLANDDNTLPDTLRAGLISLAIWVQGETSRVLRNECQPRDLVETNRAVMLGLQPHVEPDPETLQAEPA